MKPLSPYTLGRLACRHGHPVAENPYCHQRHRLDWNSGWAAEWEVIEIEAQPGPSVGALLEQLRAEGNVK